MKIQIHVPCFNRKAITAESLKTLRGAMSSHDELVCWNDGSTEYDFPWLHPFSDHVRNGPNVGVEKQRIMHLSEFWASDFDALYFTDNDCLHDPTSLAVAIRLQKEYQAALVCLYNTDAHVRLVGNTLVDDPDSEVIWRHYAPGVSYFLPRASVARIMPCIRRITNFDWNIPDLLGGRCAISRVSYVDHIGAGGLRHPAGAGLDGGDRALNPTDFLVAKRAEVVARLST